MPSNTNQLKCWCECKDFTPIRSGYFQCHNCESIISENFGKSGILDQYADKSWWFEFQERLGFPNIADKYERDYKEGYVTYFVDRILKQRIKGKVLEIGCGHGRILEELAKYGYEVAGIEVNSEVCNIATKLSGVKMFAGFFPKDILPQPEFDAMKPFDIIFAIDCFEHLDKPVEFLEGCKLSLKDIGIILLRAPLVVDRYEKGQNIPEGYWRTDTHLIFHSFKSLHMLAEKVGLFVNKPSGYYLHTYEWVFSISERKNLIDKLLSYLGLKSDRD